MKLILTFLLITFSLTAFSAENYCEKVESKGEGHWPLPEDAFTKKRAIKALKTLEKFTNHGSNSVDFVNVENELMYIKGYMLKTLLNPKDKIMLKEYCAFFKNEAYVKH